MNLKRAKNVKLLLHSELKKYEMRENILAKNEMHKKIRNAGKRMHKKIRNAGKRFALKRNDTKCGKTFCPKAKCKN